LRFGEEFARIAKSEHRIEESLERAKGEAGLAQYQVRNWIGWHHHQALSLLATWFLTLETRRGEKSVPTITVPQVRQILALLLHRRLGCDHPDTICRNVTRRLQRNEQARFYHYKARNSLAPTKLRQRK